MEVVGLFGFEQNRGGSSDPQNQDKNGRDPKKLQSTQPRKKEPVRTNWADEQADGNFQVRYSPKNLENLPGFGRHEGSVL